MSDSTRKPKFQNPATNSHPLAVLVLSLSYIPVEECYIEMGDVSAFGFVLFAFQIPPALLDFQYVFLGGGKIPKTTFNMDALISSKHAFESAWKRERKDEGRELLVAPSLS